MERPIILSYGASSYSGWGVEALNTMLYWPGEVLTALPDTGAVMRAGDPRTSIVESRLAASAAFRADLASKKMVAGKADHPVFVPLGITLDRAPVIGNTFLTGSPTIAFPYIEFPEQSEPHKAKLAEYDAIVVASEWNRQIVESWGYKPILIHQAVDTVLFNPLVRRPSKDGRFRVFSGGKAEYRKGQDIVLQAFAEFARHRDEALLVAAWSSPWPELASTFDQCPIGVPPGAHIGQPNFNSWAQSVGIKPHQFQSIPPTPNCQMIDTLANIDVAIFPNRSEGGTNQVAMECIAMGIPTVVSDCTGHLDLSESAYTISEISEEEDWSYAINQAYTVTMPDLPDTFRWPARTASLSELLS